MLIDDLLHARTVSVVESITLVFWKNKLYKSLKIIKWVFCLGDSRLYVY